jgi:hypothetical protein
VAGALVGSELAAAQAWAAPNPYSHKLFGTDLKGLRFLKKSAPPIFSKQNFPVSPGRSKHPEACCPGKIVNMLQCN